MCYEYSVSISEKICSKGFQFVYNRFNRRLEKKSYQKTANMLHYLSHLTLQSCESVFYWFIAVQYLKGWVSRPVPTSSAVQIPRAVVKGNLQRESKSVILTSPVVSPGAFCQGLSHKCFDISLEQLLIRKFYKALHNSHLSPPLSLYACRGLDSTKLFKLTSTVSL